jgi:glycosyltransferase involved in cell wall biosynthesis
VPHVWYITEPVSGNPELRALAPGTVYRTAIGALAAELAFCSRSLAADYGSLEGRSRVVYPGLPIPAARDRQVARSRLLARLALPDTTRLVGVVAALHPRKDHATFLAAAQRVRLRRPDAFFLVVGTGSPEYTAIVEARLRSLGLADCARIFGWWEGEIHELMAGLDLLVIPSIQESFGLTAVEALAVETPVVSTLCGGPAEVIREGIDGRLVPVGNVEAMADAIEATLADPSAAHALAHAGKERVTRMFTEEHFVRSMEDLIDGAWSRARRSEMSSLPARS